MITVFPVEVGAKFCYYWFILNSREHTTYHHVVICIICLPKTLALCLVEILIGKNSSKSFVHFIDRCTSIIRRGRICAGNRRGWAAHNFLISTLLNNIFMYFLCNISKGTCSIIGPYLEVQFSCQKFGDSKSYPESKESLSPSIYHQEMAQVVPSYYICNQYKHIIKYAYRLLESSISS